MHHTGFSHSLKQTLTRQVRGIAGSAAGLLFPPCCENCGDDLAESRTEASLCNDCAGRLAGQPCLRCQCCGAEIVEEAETQVGCHSCRKTRIRFDAVVVLGSYVDELRHAVLRIKRPSDEPLAHALAELLFAHRRRELIDWAPDVVVPVPMHWARRAIRGGNSPDAVAGRLARRLRKPVALGLLRRRRNTKPQAGLPHRQRLANVRGAFAVFAGYDFQGARVMLVDDILTTGATMREAAKALKAAGATQVAAVALARSPGPN